METEKTQKQLHNPIKKPISHAFQFLPTLSPPAGLVKVFRRASTGDSEHDGMTIAIDIDIALPENPGLPIAAKPIDFIVLDLLVTRRFIGTMMMVSDPSDRSRLVSKEVTQHLRLTMWAKD